MRIRQTYVKSDFADKYSDLIYEKKSSVLDMNICKVRELKLPSILKLLFELQKEPLHFSKLYHMSCIRMKKSFLIYIDYCVLHGLVEKKPVGNNVIYNVTVKGRTLLQMLEKVEK